jgi:hypothetical protein
MRRQDIVVQDFEDGGCIFSFKQRANGGQQWRKRYEDNETALIVVYHTFSRADIIDAFLNQELEKEEV